jgi:hypothetical protein
MQRVDLFTAVHKGIRALIYAQASALQAADFDDESETRLTLSQVEHTLQLLHEHCLHEERFVFSELRRFDAGITDDLQGTHRTIEKKIESAQAALVQTADAPDGRRLEAGAELNRRFNELVAFYLSHANDEDRRAVAATTKYLSDDQLVAMRIGMQSTQMRERAAEWARWMLPALNVCELARLLADTRATAPPPAFEGAAQVARQSLGEEKWQRVAAAAGL